MKKIGLLGIGLLMLVAIFFSEWPKEAGLAATRDMDLIAEFARIMAQEWTAIGLRSMYGYMADLATEPRWYRVHETFTEDADLAANIMKGPDLICFLVDPIQKSWMCCRSLIWQKQSLGRSRLHWKIFKT